MLLEELAEFYQILSRRSGPRSDFGHLGHYKN